MKKQDWNISIDVSGPPEAFIHDEMVEAVVEELSPKGAAIAVKAGYISLQFWVPASDVSEAVSNGLSVVQSAVSKLGVPGWPVVKIVATDPLHFDRELDTPAIPALVGIAEVARRLAISRQRASQLARSDRFPRPLVHLGAGPVWLEQALERFAAGWTRKAGRPAKAQPADQSRGASNDE